MSSDQNMGHHSTLEWQKEEKEKLKNTAYVSSMHADT